MKVSVIYTDETEYEIDSAEIDIKHRCVYSLSPEGWIRDVIPFENIFIASYIDNDDDDEIDDEIY